MPKRKSCKKGYSRSRSTGRCVKKCKKGQTRSRISGKCKRSKRSKRSKRRSSKKKSRAKRKRNDGSDPPEKDISWETYYKHYFNDPTFDLRRIDWTGYRGKPPAGLKIRVSSRKSKPKSRRR